ncbi:MAG: BON domain-containing protein, partial [Chitinivibrionales bacterium]|nr:BON domain-containing protein [Chitinivibrionales bacterium]
MIKTRISSHIMRQVIAWTAIFCIAGIPKHTGAAEEVPISDEDITMAVTTELSTDQAVSSHLVEVTTDKGIVTLSGSVDNLLARERAVKLTRSIKGVRGIINNLTVNPVSRSDNEIANDVISALLFDPSADSYEIDVIVENRNVTLSGKVESLAERRFAEKAAMGVKGVRSIENNCVVIPAEKRADQDIKADIERNLEFDPYVYEEMVDVEVDDGTVVLSGTVGSLSEKAFAFNDAMVPGATNVDNKLKVKLWADDPLRRDGKIVVKPEHELIESIRHSLRADERISDFDIKVAVDNSTAILTGIVDNLSAKTRAEQDARNVVGVYRVINRLRVRPEKLLDDAEIAENIQYILKWDPVVERHEITATVRNGKAYLRGKVDSKYERDRAEKTASRIPGVIEVSNHIKIRRTQWDYANDKILESAIEREFRFNWFVDEEDLEVEVTDGVAVIAGEIELKRELAAIVDNAFDAG